MATTLDLVWEWRGWNALEAVGSWVEEPVAQLLRVIATGRKSI
jgi:hypothetical protein